jgi:hypothetical protein
LYAKALKNIKKEGTPENLFPGASGFSVVCARVRRFTGDGIDATPATLFLCMIFSLLFL